jgi:hypothetical protein
MKWIKKIPCDKVSKASVQLEYELQTYIGTKYIFTPKINTITYFKDCVEISMDLIENGCTLAEHFSDDPDNIPKWVWDEIRRIIRILYYEEGIEYIDITPYNFMIDSFIISLIKLSVKITRPILKTLILSFIVNILMVLKLILS